MAIEFDGTDDFINCGTTADICQASGNQSAYFRFYLAAYTAGGQRLAQRDENGVSGDGWSFAINADGTIEFEVRGSIAYLYVLSTTTVSAAAEHTIILTWDGSTTATNVHIYLDGSEVTYTNRDNGDTLSATDTKTAFIGKITSGTAGRFFNGTMRETAFFSKVLSTEEITYLSSGNTRNKPLKIGSCVRYFTFDEGTVGTSADADTITDRTGTANATGDDGANNTGLTWRFDTAMVYPGRMRPGGRMWGGS